MFVVLVYSHSTVAVGLGVMSSSTRLTFFISVVILFTIVFSSSYGMGYGFAVTKSFVVMARRVIMFS